MSQEFKREERYQVIKIKTGKPVDCVVVEADWPEYEIVWKMIEARMNGKPTQITEPEAVISALDRLSATGEKYNFNDQLVIVFPLDEWNDFEELITKHGGKEE